MIIPAFDLIDGKAVRLYQGDYSNQKNYEIDLFQRLDDYASKGVQFLHIVDLNGAKNSNYKQLKLLQKIISYTKIPIQIGGGIRNIKDISTFFNFGAQRIVIGSSVITNKKQVEIWFKKFGPEKIVLALDIYIHSNKKKQIYINGWLKQTNNSLEEIIEHFQSIGLKHVLCTDISKDGTLLGPNFQLYQDIVQSFKNIEFQASGGVSSLQDIISLKKTKVQNIIIGRSLLEKKFTIQEALTCWQKG